MSTEYYLNTPLDITDIEKLEAGDIVFLSGQILTARDAAHKRMLGMLKENKFLPFEINGKIIYYAGPCPAPPGQVIGSVGPTTSGRMDFAAPQLLDNGLQAMIGKGIRNDEVIDAIIRNKAVYFITVGGAGAYLARKVKKRETIAFSELGAEAVYELTVENFPMFVAIDSRGNDIYKMREFTSVCPLEED